MKYIALGIMTGLLGLSGCAPSSPTPDQIRQQTATATAEAARDAKAMAQGVYEGLRTKGPLNINRATKEQLETLPGIDAVAADKIIAGRPYNDSAELPRRHIITKREYNRIADHVETK